MVVRVEYIAGNRSGGFAFKPWWRNFIISIKEELNARFLTAEMVNYKLRKYDARLEEDSARHRCIEFTNEEDATAFILRWS